MPSEDFRSQLRSQWFVSVRDLSDLDLQRQTWLDPTNRNPHWSYIEFVCSFPDADQLLSAQCGGWLSADEFAVLSALRRELVAHKSPNGNDYDNAAILNDTTWHEVVEAAEHARLQLLALATNGDERRMLERANS